MTVDSSQVDRFSRELELCSVDERILWAYKSFGNRLGLMTACGYSGVVLMHLLSRLEVNIETYFIDTGFHFPETLELVRTVRSRLGIDLKVVTSPITRAALTKALGERPWETDPDLCCQYMKIEPLMRVIRDKDAWLSAVRRDQSPTRAEIDVVEVDERDVIKIYPLADWTSEQTWSHLRDHDLPYSPLHDNGYMSVGCLHCTRPVRAGEHERAGRWASMSKAECGIHAFRRKRPKTSR